MSGRHLSSLRLSTRGHGITLSRPHASRQHGVDDRLPEHRLLLTHCHILKSEVGSRHNAKVQGSFNSGLSADPIGGSLVTFEFLNSPAKNGFDRLRAGLLERHLGAE